MVVNEWGGTDEPGSAAKGRVVAVEAPAAGAGRP
jgi:hypothetical protein